ncbi:MAG: S-layer homology domain-containing protein [Clostridia bacterium]|nr:S-layer homology domain-containing protein [Clostridia bacterium]
MRFIKLVSITLLFALTLGLTSVYGVYAKDGKLPFDDVKEEAWYYEYVKYVYENDLMQGVSETKFSPGGKLTRAMFITIIGRLVGAEGNGKTGFSDTSDNSWYSPYVSWAAGLGVVNGYPDGTFRPGDPITREQLATCVSRLLNALDLNTVRSGGIFYFNDAGKISDYAKAPIDSLKKIGIFVGDREMNFNPKGLTTRAEAATVIKRLKESIDRAWQGYEPDPEGDKPLIYGASYLFENGSICAGGMAHKLDGSGEYPLLRAYMDDPSAYRAYVEANTVGISINYGEIDVSATPYVKICFSYDGMDETALRAVYNVNRTVKETSGFLQELTVSGGNDEDGMRTAYIDLKEVSAAHSNVDYSKQIANLLFVPCGEEQSHDGSFVIRYIGFFKTDEEAKAFTSSSDGEISDYLKNYHLATDLDWREYTAEDKAYFDKLLKDRIAAIKNSPSELTPETVTARGGKCYYVSSINGDDKNDGLSPETAWKSPMALFKYYPGSDTYVAKTRKGDGVFFERGSVFYPERYHENSVSALTCTAGVDYGAYGEGPKPLFTCALDFSEYGNVGNWVATGYPNVWKIDNIDPKIGVLYDGTEVEGYWQGERSEIANMYFDEGRYVGLRIAAQGDLQTFGEGIKSCDRGMYYNGFEWYEAQERDMTDPGTTLLHNLEFFHDYETGSLYLYFDKGNPADYFHDIKAGRNGTAAWGANDLHVDNLAFVYAGPYCVRSGGTNVTFTNCEIGCAHGALSSVESGIEIYGKSDGVYMINNYIHDVGDGALTSQGGGEPGNPNQIHNVNYIGNVMVACGHGAEIWNGLSDLDENGVSASKITDCLVKDNLIAYDGFGVREKQAKGSFGTGEAICGSVGGELERCRIEGNVFLYGMGSIYCAYMATYEQPRGWESLGNTYVADGDFYSIGFSYETINYINHGMWKRARIYFPYSEEGLAWYTAQGIDPKGVFYHYESDDPHQTIGTGLFDDTIGSGYFYMTGYLAEHGE